MHHIISSNISRWFNIFTDATIVGSNLLSDKLGVFSDNF